MKEEAALEAAHSAMLYTLLMVDESRSRHFLQWCHHWQDTQVFVNMLLENSWVTRTLGSKGEGGLGVETKGINERGGEWVHMIRTHYIHV